MGWILGYLILNDSSEMSIVEINAFGLILLIMFISSLILYKLTKII